MQSLTRALASSGTRASACPQPHAATPSRARARPRRGTPLRASGRAGSRAGTTSRPPRVTPPRRARHRERGGHPGLWARAARLLGLWPPCNHSEAEPPSHGAVPPKVRHAVGVKVAKPPRVRWLDAARCVDRRTTPGRRGRRGSCSSPRNAACASGSSARLVRKKRR